MPGKRNEDAAGSERDSNWNVYQCIYQMHLLQEAQHPERRINSNEELALKEKLRIRTSSREQQPGSDTTARFTFNHPIPVRHVLHQAEGTSVLRPSYYDHQELHTASGICCRIAPHGTSR